MAQFPANIDLSSLNGSNGFRLNGVAASDWSGWSVALAGDVNGDGLLDLIVGAPPADPHGSASGASYVVFGSASGFAASFDLSSLSGSNGFKLSGVAAGDQSGFSAASAGDVNGDGFADVIVGALYADPHGSSSGASYVVFGSASGFAANVDLSSLNGSNGFKLSGTATLDFSGFSVASAGDVNGDGFDDVIVGAPAFGSPSNAGYVVFGKASGFSANLDLWSLDGGNGFKLGGMSNDEVGFSVASAGDVNGDGFADLIVGAPLTDPNGNQSGASYVVFGAASGFAATLDLSSLDGGNGFKLIGGTDQDLSGGSVASAGDVNGDGFADLIVGASGFGSNATTAYVVFGAASGFAATLDLSSLSGSNGFKLSSAGWRDFGGRWVGSAGDVNGDGFDDVIVGNSLADPHGSNSGAAYVVFGAASGFAADLDLSSLDGSSGFSLSGVAADDWSGFSVASAGDLNGDGFADVIVGAGGAGSNDQGASYVVYGRAPDTAVNRVGTAASQTLAGGAFNDALYGLGGNDRLYGNGGNDRLDGGTGADVMVGGSGNDVHFVDNAGDQVIEAVGGGSDNVYTTVSFTLPAGQEIEFLRVYGSAGLTLTGNELANYLIGGAGNDTLEGKAGNDTLYGGLGADTMTGGSGNDVYYVDNAADQVIEVAGGGSDNVYTTVSYTLAAGQEIEFLRVYGSAGHALTGNELANYLIGSSGDDTLNGGAGSDTLYGGLGTDAMAGGSGNDTYFVDMAGDQVIEAVGDGSDTVYATVSYALAAGLEVEFLRVYGSASLTLTGNGLANYLIGGSGSDTLNGGGGDDRLDGGFGADAMTGGSGNDFYYVDNVDDQVIETAGGGSDNVYASVSYTLAAGLEVEFLRVYGTASLTLTGNELANYLIGGSGNDTLNGGAGNDTLHGGLGADMMTGGSGNDLYYVDSAGDQVIEAAGGGGDTIYAGIDFTLAAGQEVEYLQVYGSSGLTLTGNELANYLIGGAGNDTLNGAGGDDTLYGGLGADAMAGGSGNDLYYVDSVGDQVLELTGGGNDTVYASVDYTLAAGRQVEVLRVYGSAGLTLTGNEFANALIGGSGSDTLDGGAGADTMTGGAGNDTYYVDAAGDHVIEAAGGGSDTIYTSVDYTLAAGQEVESLNVFGDNGLHLTGNNFGMQLIGSIGTDALTGGAGNDTIRGGAEISDPFDPPPGDTLRGGAGDDHIFGGAGSDIIDGGAGADIMDTGSQYFGSLIDGTIIGIPSSDTIYVDNAGDQVVGSTWTSTLYVSTDWTATGNVSGATLRVVGSAGLHLTASGIKYVLIGGAGDDTLTGSGFALVLDGGAGADIMKGGAGRNTYYVDNVGDQVIDAPHGDGTGFSGDPPTSDIIYASVDYTVAAGQEIEHMYALGTNGLHLTGNEFAMNLYGNVGNDTLTTHAGNDQLDGGAGADVMTGGGGNDTYYIENAGDHVIEAAGGGHDTIYTAINYTLAATLEIESLRVNGESGLHLTGNNFGMELVGGNGDDTLTGGTGSDRLDGGREGSDLLVGGAGVDTFVFDYGSHFESNDSIQDFDASNETIALNQWEFAGFGVGTLGAAQFSSNGPTGSNAQIVYDIASGALSYYPQNGASVQFATIENHASLSASNFVVF